MGVNDVLISQMSWSKVYRRCVPVVCEAVACFANDLICKTSGAARGLIIRYLFEDNDVMFAQAWRADIRVRLLCNCINVHKPVQQLKPLIGGGRTGTWTTQYQHDANAEHVPPSICGRALSQSA
jgi:hypothetical protein